MRRVILLQQQVHDGDGGLDLVGPEGVVIGQLPQAVFLLRRQPGPVLTDGPQQRLIVLFQQSPGGRQGQGLLPRLPQKLLQLPVPPEKAAVSYREEDQPQHQTQYAGIDHRLQGQVVEGKYRPEHTDGSRQQQQQFILAFQVSQQHPQPSTR